MVQKDNAAHAVQQNHMKNNQYVEKKKSLILTPFMRSRSIMSQWKDFLIILWLVL